MVPPLSIHPLENQPLGAEDAPASYSLQRLWALGLDWLRRNTPPWSQS